MKGRTAAALVVLGSTALLGVAPIRASAQDESPGAASASAKPPKHAKGNKRPRKPAPSASASVAPPTASVAPLLEAQPPAPAVSPVAAPVARSPPAPAASVAGPTAADRKVPKDDKDADGNLRMLEILWANAQGGFSYVSMASINSKNLEVKDSSGAGGVIGLGAGVRLLIFALGFRARINALSSFSLWELDGELGIHVPFRKWDPYFGFHGGYAFVGSITEPTSDISIHGADAGMMFGADYYVLPYFSLGLDATADGLFLTRPPAPLPGDFKALPPAAKNAIKNNPLYKESGDSVGFGVSGSLRLGIHL